MDPESGKNRQPCRPKARMSVLKAVSTRFGNDTSRHDILGSKKARKRYPKLTSTKLCLKPWTTRLARVGKGGTGCYAHPGSLCLARSGCPGRPGSPWPARPVLPVRPGSPWLARSGWPWRPGLPWLARSGYPGRHWVVQASLIWLAYSRLL